MQGDRDHDVFFSHNSRDKVVVKELAIALQTQGIRVWLDEWELVPGKPWLEEIEIVMRATPVVAVLLGSHGVSGWQTQEMQWALQQTVDRDMQVIPVLLPGAPAGSEFPLYFQTFTWVDLRAGLSEEGLDRLRWGITGMKPDWAIRERSPPEQALPRHPSPDATQVLLERKLEILLREAVITSDGCRKFELVERIRQTRHELGEL